MKSLCPNVVTGLALVFGLGCGSVSSPADPDAALPGIDSAVSAIDAAVQTCDPAVVFSMAGDIHRVEADGSGLTNLTNRPGDQQFSPRVAPGGTHISYESTEVRGSGDIFIMESDGSNPLRASLDAGDIVGISAWTSNSRIAFVTNPGGGVSSQIVVVNLDGSGRQMVATDLFPGSSLLGSLSAGKLMYSENIVSGAAPLKLINFDGTAPLIIAPGAGHKRFSPDGSQVVYTSSSIFVVDVDATDRIELTANASELDFFPSWTADGNQIYFRRNLGVGQTPQTDLFVMNSDGTGQTNITNSAESESEPFLSPDGEVLVYTSSAGLTLAAPDGSNPQLVAGSVGAIDPQWTPCTSN